MDILIKNETSAIQSSIKNVDMEQLRSLANHDTQVESLILRVFGEESDQKCHKINVYELKLALNILLSKISKKLKLETTYTFRGRIMPTQSLKVTGTSVSGMAVDGEMLHLVGGVGNCIVEKLVNKDGEWVVVECEDISGRTSILMGELGRFQILKDTSSNSLSRRLSEFIGLLENSEFEEDSIVCVFLG